MVGGKGDYCPEHTVSLLEGLQARVFALADTRTGFVARLGRDPNVTIGID